jgi:hypothetical protein
MFLSHETPRSALGPTEPPVSLNTGVIYRASSFRCVNLTTRPYLRPGLRVTGSVPLLPPYTLMASTGTTLPSLRYCKTVMHSALSELRVNYTCARLYIPAQLVASNDAFSSKLSPFVSHTATWHTHRRKKPKSGLCACSRWIVTYARHLQCLKQSKIFSGVRFSQVLPTLRLFDWFREFHALDEKNIIVQCRLFVNQFCH